MRNPGGPRFGLGPVFVYDWLIASRRWQGYALRSGFVGLLLGALILVRGSQNSYGDELSISQLAYFGQQFFSAVVGTAITMVLLVAPAATAGAICLDRARGTMTHLLVTDLSGAEIVLGKLAARLVPVLGLVGCALPVLAILTLIGGVDPEDLAGAFLVTVGVAILGCSIALLFSIRAGKTHEALLGTYAVWFFWLMADPIAMALDAALGTSLRLRFPMWKHNPFGLCLWNTSFPGSVTLGDYLNFLAGSLTVSAVLVAVSVLTLRPVCAREGGPRRRGLWAILGSPLGRLMIPSWFSGASLDGNPVYWRECRRGHSSRWTRALNFLFVGVSFTFSAVIIATSGGPAGREALVMVNALHIAVGLLMLGVSAGTSLAEERVRGSLDVLMTTNLSTREIVLGKWLGTFRKAPWLAALPVVNLFAMSSSSLRAVGASVLTVLCVLSLGAAVTSLGLAMATTFSRLGRAVGMTVGVFVVWSVGWCFFVAMTVHPSDPREFFLMASPFGFAAFVSAYGFENFNGLGFVPGASAFWTMADTAFAGVLLTVVLNTFNSRLGRVEFGGGYRRHAPLDKPARVEEVCDTLFIS